MKHLLFTMLMAAPALSYAQDQLSLNSEIKSGSHQYSCQEFEMTPDNKTITLRKNVKLETENLTLLADSAVFDNASETWMAYGTKEVVFKGAVVVVKEKPGNVVRYRLKDKTIYLE